MGLAPSKQRAAGFKPPPSQSPHTTHTPHSPLNEVHNAPEPAARIWGVHLPEMLDRLVGVLQEYTQKYYQKADAK